jgi:hypothetical protein
MYAFGDLADCQLVAVGRGVRAISAYSAAPGGHAASNCTSRRNKPQNRERR